ncbi:MAG: VOC family protein [Flavobacterium sp.]|uniref:VOC family protein n=1 Tax=Flavobacterium sp. TaxID=239 RepID=UPI00326506CB
MKEKITPCLWFDGQAKEAADLYCSIFKDAKITSQSPIVTEISASGQSITLLDGGPMYQPNPSISFYYTCEEETELQQIWEALSNEGTIMMPLDKYPWSEKYGWITDKFGISWQLSLGKISDVGQKIAPFLMFTGKNCGRAEEAIKHYTTIFKNPKTEGIYRYDDTESPNKEGTIKHAQIILNDQTFMLMDSATDHKFNFTEGVSLTIHCENQEEIDYYWEKLTEDGEESRCGWLKDKFQVSWQIIPNILGKLMSDPKTVGKAAQAFMSMRKINIEQIVQATIE